MLILLLLDADCNDTEKSCLDQHLTFRVKYFKLHKIEINHFQMLTVHDTKSNSKIL